MKERGSVYFKNNNFETALSKIVEVVSTILVEKYLMFVKFTLNTKVAKNYFLFYRIRWLNSSIFPPPH